MAAKASRVAFGEALIGLGARAAENRLQTGDQLTRPERLGDVVVGTCVECPDLLLLLADRGKDEDWHLAPPPELGAYVHSVPVGQDQVDDRRVWVLDRRGVEVVLVRDEQCCGGIISSAFSMCPGGEIGRRKGLKIPRA